MKKEADGGENFIDLCSETYNDHAIIKNEDLA